MEEITYEEVENYFWKQMEQGKIRDEYEQMIFEKAIEALQKCQKSQ
jgi:hypothetical protein